MKTKSLPILALLMLLFIVPNTLTSSVLVAAQKGKRIQFAQGRTTTVLKGTLQPDGQDSYLLRARAGQTMIVHVTSKGGSAVVGIQTPQGRNISEENPFDTDWSVSLPSSGDYRLNVHNLSKVPRDTARYTLEVTIR